MEVRLINNRCGVLPSSGDVVFSRTILFVLGLTTLNDLWDCLGKEWGVKQVCLDWEEL